MKHLKTYENIEQDKILKYMIWATPNPPFKPSFYHIVKLLFESKNKVFIDILYTYDIEEKSLTKEKSRPYNKETELIKYSIVFQSNDLQECIDMIPILNKSNQYNL